MIVSISIDLSLARNDGFKISAMEEHDRYACWRCGGDGKIWQNEVIVLRGTKMVREPMHSTTPEITCPICKVRGKRRIESLLG